MNIAFFRHSISNYGSDKVIADYSDYLTGHDHHIFYYTSKFKSQIRHNSAIQFKQIPLPAKWGTVVYLFFKKFKEDKLIVDLIVFACLASFRNRRKVIYFAQDYDVFYYSSPLLKNLMHVCYWWALKILKVPTISVSQGLADRLKKYGNPAIKVVNNGIDLKIYYHDSASMYLSKKKCENIILLFVREDFRKGIDIAIKALKGLIDQKELNFEVWTIGNALEEIKGLKITNFGFLDPVELPKILSAADIYFFASRSEGLSTLLLQALACGCAIVATDVANCITHDVQGLICPIEDWQSLSLNLNYLLSHPQELARYKKNARILAEQYSIDKSKKEFEQAISGSSSADVI